MLKRRASVVVVAVSAVLVIGLITYAQTKEWYKGGTSCKASIDMARAVVGPSGPVTVAMKLYKSHTGKFPKELKYLLEKPADPGLAEKWAGPYLEDPSGLKDPWGRDYGYVAPGKHNERAFDLWSNGPDGKAGTDDDICNWKTTRR